MVFSTLQFFITIVLAIVCARTFSLSSGDIPVLALIIPALWILPQARFSGVVMVAALTCYGLTLPHQPVTLSVSVWTLIPLLMVIFSKRSSVGVIVTAALIVTTLQVGIMVTQVGGKLGGSAWVTAMQTISVVFVWWAAYRWKPSDKHSWWALMLIAPLWIAGLTYAALVTLCITGIIASMESLSKLRSFRWNKLLCWTLPTVGFAALVVTPGIEVPNPVFVVWLCLLATAWMTDYILRSIEENQEV